MRRPRGIARARQTLLLPSNLTTSFTAFVAQSAGLPRSVPIAAIAFFGVWCGWLPTRSAAHRTCPRVRPWVSDGTMGGDPAPGLPKTLKVIYLNLYGSNDSTGKAVVSPQPAIIEQWARP